MENNVVTLETAKKLKATGWKQKSSHWRWTWRAGSHYLREHYAERLAGYGLADAPTAQEIADQLPADDVIISRWQKIPAKWAVNMHGHFTNEMSDTMAEALANLWLKLHELPSESGEAARVK